MSLGAGIFDFLENQLAADDRIYPLSLPQGVELPAITDQVISDVPTNSHSTMQDHPTYTGVRHAFTRVQFNCYGSTYDEAEALCNELDALLSGASGLWGTVEVDSVRLELRLDDWDEDLEERGIYRVIRDVIVSHTYQPGS